MNITSNQLNATILNLKVQTAKVQNVESSLCLSLKAKSLFQNFKAQIHKLNYLIRN